MPATPDQVRRAIENYVKAWATNDKKLFLSLFAPDAQDALVAKVKDLARQAGRKMP